PSGWAVQPRVSPGVAGVHWHPGSSSPDGSAAGSVLEELGRRLVDKFDDVQIRMMHRAAGGFVELLVLERRGGRLVLFAGARRHLVFPLAHTGISRFRPPSTASWRGILAGFQPTLVGGTRTPVQ